MEAKYMKTSHSRAWECKHFTHGFLTIRIIENMEIKVHTHTPYTQSCNQMDSTNSKHHSNKCVINMRVWGNGEEGMREYEDRREFKIYGTST